MGIADAQLKDKVPVTLAGRDFVVKVVPMARIRQLAGVVSEAMKEADNLNATDEEAVSGIVDKLLQFPHKLLSLFIDNLPAEIFTDEQNGVTFPEFWDVLQIALTINRVDQLKNVFSRLVPLMSQASTSQKTN
ncbi:hypothetical protein [Alicyclobacillus ferrooxydans]|uniref:Uncharacterized protein n=1 Tax=Alicyclobacillus ferrooxydans TaxID=471514 RepID=A0A0P9CYL3_9BACL|nr:hypothetical protein [Alicyclobacillus ferrooxydans]KPV42023.1 hypothetical protein AN477_19840 [Alicyclobacillus ferrooxydans]